MQQQQQQQQAQVQPEPSAPPSCKRSRTGSKGGKAAAAGAAAEAGQGGDGAPGGSQQGEGAGGAGGGADGLGAEVVAAARSAARSVALVAQAVHHFRGSRVESFEDIQVGGLFNTWSPLSGLVRCHQVLALYQQVTAPSDVGHRRWELRVLLGARPLVTSRRQTRGRTRTPSRCRCRRRCCWLRVWRWHWMARAALGLPSPLAGGEAPMAHRGHVLVARKCAHSRSRARSGGVCVIRAPRKAC